MKLKNMCKKYPMQLSANKDLVHFLRVIQTDMETRNKEAVGNTSSKKIEIDISTDLHSQRDYKSGMH